MVAIDHDDRAPYQPVRVTAPPSARFLSQPRAQVRRESASNTGILAPSCAPLSVCGRKDSTPLAQADGVRRVAETF